MAAARDSRVAEDFDDVRLVDLLHLGPGSLNAILEEETAVWRSTLDWDFRSSAGLVRHFHDIRALSGVAMLVGGIPAGYAYHVAEDHKGLIGDLYLMRRANSPARQMLVLGAIVDQLTAIPGLRRIESQLMMLDAPRLADIPMRRFVHVFPRLFLEIDLRGFHLGPSPAAQAFTFSNWSEPRHDEAAAVLADAYRDHIDSDINDQYRSAAGARRFLGNIIQYPGCGSFFRPGSFIALATATGAVVGLSLSSLIASDVGHITQLCVSPTVRGRGLGYELLRRSLDALSKAGCRSASLTVTAANTGALQLYERVGFLRRASFSAHVWEGF